MRDILPDLDLWLADDERSIALATVVQTWGSSPRRAGAKMGILPDGRITGSVSGGCVEGAVFEAGAAVLRSGVPKRLRFGVADETAWEVGLACGGSIDIFVKPLDLELYESLHSVLVEERTAVLVSVVRGPDEILGREMLCCDDGEVTGSISKELDGRVLHLARETLSGGTSRLLMPSESTEIFLDVIMPPPTLIAVGGVHITIALMALAKTLGYRTVVIDPRTAFGSKARFPHVDRLLPVCRRRRFSKFRSRAQQPSPCSRMIPSWTILR